MAVGQQMINCDKKKQTVLKCEIFMSEKSTSWKNVYSATLKLIFGNYFVGIQQDRLQLQLLGIMLSQYCGMI
jgi:hypothetical protein